MSNPTDSDYLNLINNVAQGGIGAVPPGWKPLVPFTANNATGFQAGAFVNAAGQIVIAFNGPTLSAGNGASASDEELMNGQQPVPLDGNVDDFVSSVLMQAQAEGLLAAPPYWFTKAPDTLCCVS